MITRAAASAVLTVVATLVAPLLPVGGGAFAPVASAAPAGDDQVVAFVARGVGNGHGRGLSQWGSYGRAVDGGQSWTQILDAYYGGTVPSAVAPGERAMSVRLTGWDDSTALGVVDGSGNVVVNGVATGAPSVEVVETGQNQFQIWVAAPLQCPAGTGGWVLWNTLTGPITLMTAANESTASANQVLGLCTGDSSLVQYRGSIEMRDVLGSNRVVNRLDIDNYLRGVVPRESPASWGSAGGGAGMNALMAQSVAARSYAISQNRYSVSGSVYAKTCDTSSCQVYGGAGTKPTASSAGVVVSEDARTDLAVATTAPTAAAVRRTTAGAIVSTEFSASNGPYTAGGSFPSIDDPFDDVTSNPLHRWTRLIDADWLASWCGIGNANGVATVAGAPSSYVGVWNNRLTGCAGKTILDLRNALSFPSHGFDLVPITRDVTSSSSFSFIGDSVGVSIAGDETGTLRTLLDGVYPSSTWDSLGARPTQGGSTDGVAAANAVPVGTDLVVVELGYNDSPSAMSARIDALMGVLTARNVARVAWVTVSERRTSTPYATTNAAIHEAVNRWSNLTVFDWEAASDDAPSHRWFADGVHLTATGRAEFALFLREQMFGVSGRPLVPGVPLRVPVLGQFGVPASGAVGVALNVTAVNPSGPGWLRVWPCGSPEPTTSSVNYMARGAIEPNAVVVPVDDSGEVCVSTLTSTEVLVDVSGWFDAGLRSGTGRLIDTRDDATPRTVRPGSPLRVPVLGQFDVPDDGSAVGVALNVTAVDTSAAGWLRVWPCGEPEPPTSSVNYMGRGAIEPNAVVVPVDDTGEVCVSTLVDTEVIVDITGWFDTGLQLASGRIVDTRDDGAVRTVVPGTPLRVAVTDQFGVPGDGSAVGVSLNVTAVDTSGPGWLRVWPCNSPEPETSSVNYLARGAIEPNAVVVPVDASGEVCVSSLVDTEVIVDITGWFDAGLQSGAGRVVDTRTGLGPIPGR